jgi:hypothetical protein
MAMQPKVKKKIQCNSIQNPNAIFHRNRKYNPKIHMEALKTLKSQSNTVQGKQLLEVSQYLT